MTDRDDERELGYWLGKPFWGKGIMSEAVQEKCGFKYQWRSAQPHFSNWKKWSRDQKLQFVEMIGGIHEEDIE